MNDLRKDINAVFARQQGQLGDMSSAGNRMLRAASAERRSHRQLRTALAGVALVFIAAAAVGVSVVIRTLHPTNVVGSPHSIRPFRGGQVRQPPLRLSGPPPPEAAHNRP